MYRLIPWCAAVLAVATGCDDRRVPPRTAVARCLAAARAADRDRHDGNPRALACDELYSNRRCAAAWRAIVTAPGPATVAAILEPCRQACVVLSGGAVPRACGGRVGGDALAQVVAVDQAVLELEGVPRAAAAELSRRIRHLQPAGVGVPRARPPSPPPPPGPDQLTIRLTPTDVQIDGRVVAPDEVPAVLAAASARGVEEVVLVTPPDLPYGALIDFMDKVHASGVVRIALRVEHDDAAATP